MNMKQSNLIFFIITPREDENAQTNFWPSRRDREFLFFIFVDPLLVPLMIASNEMKERKAQFIINFALVPGQARRGRRFLPAQKGEKRTNCYSSTEPKLTVARGMQMLKEREYKKSGASDEFFLFFPLRFSFLTQ